MKTNEPPYESFYFQQVYHLYTRVSGNESIFRNDNNYTYFLGKIEKYLLPYLEIHAYCLVPQRFSLLVCFRSQKEIFNSLKRPDEEMSEDKVHQFLMQPISNLLNSYSKAYNKMFGRKGALFVDYIKREKIDDVELLKNIFRKIHQIPSESFLKCQFQDWKYSSYQSYINEKKPSKINRELMNSYFLNKEDFIKFHHHLKT